MATIQSGGAAPAFSLTGTDGKKYSLADALRKGPVLAAFFKVSCPVCQFTFPFLERLYETYGDAKASFWAISQDDAADTKEFCQEYGIKFPALVDADGYPVSNQFGLTNVPSIFLIAPDGQVKASSIGFSRAEIEKMNAEVARASGKTASPVFRPDEVIPDNKPG
jgi:peroxiredoxin